YEDASSGTGDPAWFLPVGPSGTEITRFSGVKLWDVMQKMAYTIGYLLFFDYDGILHFEKFLPFNNPGVNSNFFEDDLTLNTFGIWELKMHRTLADVRNQITIIGVSAFAPLWNPINVHIPDMASINDPEVFNHIGYEQPFVWADTQFANIDYATSAANAMLEFMRLPSVFITFRTWLHPEIYPLQIIGVDSWRMEMTGKRFMVLSVNHRVHSGTLGETTIGARWMGE
ncbi:MAG: hypothetical protein NTZ48_04185, partial [Candidatus Omnitrophica bacterium]|nr:hypothetical protein [Candidatus Omnitrophota bacterium]